jgi:acetyl/propionyl-CoA carboxylase alpha subunit
VIHAFSVPGGPGVRVDTLAHSECTISPYYDSMIAKIIVHGRDRQEAIARMRRTLEMTVIEGIKTTVPLQLKIIAEPDFVAGKAQHGLHGRFAPAPKATRLADTAWTRLHAIVGRRGRGRAALAPLDVARAFSRRRRPLSCSCERKSLASRTFLELADACVALAAPYGASIIVNDRADIARLSEPPACIWARTTCG